ncbi:MAG TPA: transposase [Candidatus Competibacteraceae bacterium]|nr:transposase [Candidatus Competibacteraceae bacterium]
MGKQRRTWSVEEKLGIVLAVLSGRQSVAEISRQQGVNENQIYRWKEQFLEAGRQGLNGAKAQTADQRLETENIVMGNNFHRLSFRKGRWIGV